ncbi:MAG: polysaccharide biosynthesis tyrosine autokinase [Beijerinckiaceae bacterium]|nr:polysaccharide biosynthesis tyrosine autokinase [Beijerinckiaceae bacterium]
MLKVDQRLLPDEANLRPASSLEPGQRNFYIRVLRHQSPTVIVFMVLSMALAIFYLYTAVPTYVATAYMVIDERKVRVLDPQEDTAGSANVDSGFVSTQIELLKSQNVSRAVIKKLNLTEDPEFIGTPPGFFGTLADRLFSFGRPAPPPLPAEEAASRRLRAAQAAFASQRTVTRVGQSYVLQIDFQSQSAKKAAQVANALAEAYIDDKLEAKYEETRRANDWLQIRLKDLRAQVAAEQKAVVDFRQKYNMAYVDTGGGKFSVDTSGRTMSEQQLSEINSQLIVAEAATAQEKARYDRIREVMKQDVPDASVTEALNNQIIVKLRTQYIDLLTRSSLYSQRYGSEHLSVVAQKSQMRELLRAIKDEMGKIEQSAKSDYEIAAAREKSLRASVDSAMSRSQITNQAQIQLQELESKAQTSRTLHDNFLQHYMQTIQEQTFPITEARLVGPAEPPMGKTYPKSYLILALAAVGGAVLSFGVASAREMLDRVFRSSDQVGEELLTDCLAMLPLVAKESSAPDAGNPGPGQAGISAEPMRLPARPMLEIVLDKPFSNFSEALRAVKVASDLSAILKTKKVTGFISTIPGEGKSTISANYAQLIAHAGTRAVLIDADLRNPTLSVQLARECAGLIDVLAGWKSLDEVLLADPRSGLRFLPAGSKPNMPHTNDLLASEAMKKLIANLQENYDYVIVDLPPLIPVVDARASSGFIDSYICVVQWGFTKIDVVKHALLNAPELYDRLLGVILNKVDMSAVGRYERYRNNYYYEKYRARYSNPDPAGSAAARNSAEIVH